MAYCPTCKRTVKLTPDNPFRPFCSERCRLVDLGKWAQEHYRIPGSSDEARTDEPEAKELSEKKKNPRTKRSEKLN